MNRAKKKYLSAIILIILTFAMVSCKGNKGGGDKRSVRR